MFENLFVSRAILWLS